MGSGKLVLGSRREMSCMRCWLRLKPGCGCGLKSDFDCGSDCDNDSADRDETYTWVCRGFPSSCLFGSVQSLVRF